MRILCTTLYIYDAILCLNLYNSQEIYRPIRYTPSASATPQSYTPHPPVLPETNRKSYQYLSGFPYTTGESTAQSQTSASNSECG